MTLSRKWLDQYPSSAGLHLFDARDNHDDPDLPPMVVGRLVSTLARCAATDGLIRGVEDRSSFYVLGTNVYGVLNSSSNTEEHLASLKTRLSGVCDAFFDRNIMD